MTKASPVRPHRMQKQHKKGPHCECQSIIIIGNRAIKRENKIEGYY